MWRLFRWRHMSEKTWNHLTNIQGKKETRTGPYNVMFLLTLEIDTPAGSRKTLYPLRKLTIFNGVLIFETGCGLWQKGVPWDGQPL